MESKQLSLNELFKNNIRSLFIHIAIVIMTCFILPLLFMFMGLFKNTFFTIIAVLIIFITPILLYIWGARFIKGSSTKLNIISCCSPSLIGIILWIICFITSPNDITMTSGGLWLIYGFYNGGASLVINSLIFVFRNGNIINPLTLLLIGFFPSTLLFLGLQIKMQQLRNE